jgi:hypothetical protein
LLLSISLACAPRVVAFQGTSLSFWNNCFQVISGAQHFVTERFTFALTGFSESRLPPAKAANHNANAKREACHVGAEVVKIVGTANRRILLCVKFA